MSTDSTPASIDYAHCARELRALEMAFEFGDLTSARAHLYRALETLEIQPRSLPVRRRSPHGTELTAREIVILRRLPDGSLSQKDIARELGVSRNTVKTHIKSLYLKLGAHCRGEAIQRAREMGLLFPVTLPGDGYPALSEAV